MGSAEFVIEEDTSAGGAAVDGDDRRAQAAGSGVIVVGDEKIVVRDVHLSGQRLGGVSCAETVGVGNEDDGFNRFNH
jgi:hypothetical protein